MILFLSETADFIETSPVFIKTSSEHLELSSSFTNPTTSPLHLQKSTNLVLDEPSSLSFLNPLTSESPTRHTNQPLVTETVFGFLNFVTTVRNTVMVFTQAVAGMVTVHGYGQGLHVTTSIILF